MNKKQKRKMHRFDAILLVLQLILSVTMIGLLTYYQILPTWGLVIIVVLLALACFLAYFSFNASKRTKVNITLGRIFSIIVSVCLLLGNVLAFDAFDALNTVSGAKYRIDAMSVIVLEDSAITSIEDALAQPFGVNGSNDLDNTKYAVEKINSDYKQTITVNTYSDFIALVDALYNKEVNAIIINEAFRSLIEEDNEAFSSETRVILQIDKKTVVEPTVQKGFDVTQDPFNVYLSGIDTFGPVSITARSDVNMIISVNPKTKQVLLVNIPRDYYVPLACQNGAMDKLTHAGVYGVDCSMQTLEQFMGIDISYYARVNFSSLVNIVDALGGIEVYTETTFSAYNRATLQRQTFYAGTNKLDGASALAYSRERKTLPGGDRDRGKNQQAVIQGIVNKALSPAIVANYASVLNAVAGSFQTNMESKDISKLIKMQLSDMAQWTINSVSLDGSGSYGPTFSYGDKPLYVMIPNMDTVANAQAKIKEIFATSSEK